MRPSKDISRREGFRLPPYLINRQICCDNRDLFRQLPDESVDLILTDPPYKNYQSNRPVAHPRVKAVDAGQFHLDLFARESFRVLRKGHHLYCFCDHLTFPAIRNGLEEAGFTYKNCLVWVKNNHGSGDLRGNWAPQHEFIIFASKGRGLALKGRRSPNVLLKRAADGSVQFYSKVSNYRFNHGTAKPVEILRLLIRASTERGDLVLDPYGGSGSTAEACLRERRRFILAEIDPDYASHAKERIAEIRSLSKPYKAKHRQVTP